MIDFKKEKTYKTSLEPENICLQPMLFIKVDGTGSPGSDEFQQAVQVLYGVVYAIKFWDKTHNPPKDYDKFTGAPLEGIWWTKTGKEFDIKKPEDWMWTVMMRVPEFVTETFFREVISELCEKKKTDIYEKARLEAVHEGLCVQIMHLGPYDKEQASLDKLFKYVKSEGYEIYGRHHEIYFNDPRRVPEEKIKTILRYPVRKKDSEVILPKI